MLLSQHKGSLRAAKRLRPGRRSSASAQESPPDRHQDGTSSAEARNTVLEPLTHAEKTVKIKKRHPQGLFLVHCFLNPSILGVSGIVFVHELETVEFLGTEVKTL